MDHPKQLARIGLFYIEEAILEVLFEAKAKTLRFPTLKVYHCDLVVP